MGIVFVDVGMSLDGCIAGPNGGPKNPMGGVSRDLHAWMFSQKGFLEHVGLPGGESGGPDDLLIRRTFERIGANIMGRHMFDEGEAAWPENAPFHCPVYVHTHRQRPPWVRKGGTTFYFTQGSLKDTLDEARRAAGAKDVRISGGADAIRQYLAAGLVNELTIHLAPMVIGNGVRLFDGLDPKRIGLELKEAVHAPLVTHLTYRIRP